MAGPKLADAIDSNLVGVFACWRAWRICVIIASGLGRGAGDMASADVATAKAKATLINNLTIVSSHIILSRGRSLSRGCAVTNAGAATYSAACLGNGRASVGR